MPDYIMIIVAVVAFLAVAASLYAGKTAGKPGFDPQSLAWSLVQAAEQVFDLDDGDTNADKYDYVENLMHRAFPSLDIDVIEALIESAVHTLKQYKPEPQLLPVLEATGEVDPDKLAAAVARHLRAEGAAGWNEHPTEEDLKVFSPSSVLLSQPVISETE